MRNTGIKDHWTKDAILDTSERGRTLRRLHNSVVMRERVLLVEDDEALGFGISEHLNARGFEVTRVGDGVSAIEKLLATDFDVLLLDLGIPRMSGHKLLHEIRREPDIQNLPIVLFTGGDTETVERAARHGVFAIHRKPAKPRHIAQSLRAAAYYG